MEPSLSSIKARVDLVELVAKSVPLVHRNGAFWGLCPFHDDKNPSFKVDRQEGKFHCFGCGAHGDAIDWLERREKLSKAEAIRRLKEIAGVDPAPAKASKPEEPQALAQAAVYEYRDEAGDLAYVKVRYVKPDGKKTFAFKHPENGRLESGKGDTPWLLYRLPELREAIERGERVYINEGEKAVDALLDAGFAATCTCEGATGERDKELRWKLDYDHQLRGCREAVVVADIDPTGEHHAKLLAKHLSKFVPKVRVVQSATGKEKHDAYDHLQAGLWPDDFTPRPDLEPRKRFPIYTLDDLEKLPPKPWILEGLIGVEDTIVVYGKAGGGKTFVVLDILCSVIRPDDAACGGEFRLRREPVQAVYAAGEKFYGMRDRMTAVAKKRDLARFPGADRLIHVVRGVPQLWDEQSEDNVDVFLEEMLAAYPNGVGLLAIDTMHAATVGMEENSTTDTGVVIHNLKRIKAVLGCAVILVHHANKLGDIRGSTALVGAADAVYSVSDSSEEQAEGGAKRFHAQKVADAADDWTLGFDLVPVEVNKPEEWERKSMAVQWRGFPFETSRTVRDEVVRILRSQQHDVPLDTIWGMNTLAKETTRAAFRKALEQMVLEGSVERRLLDPKKPEGRGNKPLYKLKPGYSDYRAWNEE